VGYDYGTTDNNGNVRKQTLTVPGMTTITQAYKYDGANRLQVVAEQPVNPALPACDSSADVDAGGWCHKYSYDMWGNRGVTSPFPLPITTPLSYDPASNHILGANWGYTARGEISGDPSGRTFAYDAEGHLKQTMGANGTTVYSYDAQGQRVRKDTAGGSTVYIYDAFGNLGAEYSTVPQSASCQTCYLTPDHLGSTRVVTGPTGQPMARHDYEPFGGEISFGTSSPRDGIAGYGAPDTDVHPQFTGKERDAETGLDYFGARYFSAAQGRWTSPDLINLTWDRLENPSNTLNKYVYAANNPLKFVDPDGQDITLFYQPSESSTNLGDYGHAFLAAYDESTNQVEFLDYYPEDRNNLQLQGGEFVGPGAFNSGTFNERRSGFESLTIQTTPEVTQKVMAFMRDFKARKPSYSFPWSSTCVTACRAALEVAGIRVSAYSPAGLWRALYRRYSPSYRMMLGDGKSLMPPITSRPGMDSGSPRTDPMEWQRFLFNLWLQQIERQREEEERKRREREYEPPGYGR
jgi:RHS repeat-associated protein